MRGGPGSRSDPSPPRIMPPRHAPSPIMPPGKKKGQGLNRKERDIVFEIPVDNLRNGSSPS